MWLCMFANNIVKNQHVLPAKSIGRFGDEKGQVQVYRLENKKIFPASPKNGIFCVNRVWDQRSEQGYGKRIEDSFQSLMTYVLSNQLISLPPEGHKIVSKFYALWCLRSKIETYDKYARGEPVGMTGEELTEEQKIVVELKHGIYAESGGVVPERFSRCSGQLKLANPL